MKRCRKCKVPLEGKLSKILSRLFGVGPSAAHADLCERCARDLEKKPYVCQICNRSIDEEIALTHVKSEEYLIELIRKDHPEWKKEEGTCDKCIDYYRELIKKAKI